jgi:hypothetical protein
MKYLGLVQSTNVDKYGDPIAWVRPLYEIQSTEYRTINDVKQEFPSQGQVFWFNATTAVQESLIFFNAKPNPGQRDEFCVENSQPVYEVLDLRNYGDSIKVRFVLTEGIRLPGPFGAVRVFVWCHPDMLIGPVDVKRDFSNIVKLSNANLSSIKAFSKTRIRQLTVDQTLRLLRDEETAPIGCIDWDDDAKVLRRALEISLRVAHPSTHETGKTKRQIEEATRNLVTQGVGPDTYLDRYRLERALSLFEHTDIISSVAGNFVGLLRDHPVIKGGLDELSAKIKTDTEQQVRTEMKQRLTREQDALKETAEHLARTQSDLEMKQQELRQVEEQISEVRKQAEKTANEVESMVNARVHEVINRPLNILAEVSILRPLLGIGGNRVVQTTAPEGSARVDWSRTQGHVFNDKVSMRRILTSAARSRGVDPSLMMQIHAAIVARVLPVTLGSRALASLIAYAFGACGSRYLIIPVSPSVIRASELDNGSEGGLVTAAEAAKDVDGISLAILEGANRSPLEASLIPILQLADIGMSPRQLGKGLRLVASFVTGATTVPVSSQLWNYATAIYPEPLVQNEDTGSEIGDISLSSDLLIPGDAPTEVVEELVDLWPDCRELLPVLIRLGSALTRLYDEKARIADALLNGIVLPYIATSLTIEEQVEAVNRAGDADDARTKALRRLRKRLC